MDWKRRRWGKNAPFSKRRGICRGGGNSGINLLVQRFRIDDEFRNAVIKGNYRYSNGALFPISNNPQKIIIFGSVQKYGSKRGIYILPPWMPKPEDKKYKCGGGHVRRGYGYGYPFSRLAPEHLAIEEHIEDKRRSKGHTILLTPIAR